VIQIVVTYSLFYSGSDDDSMLIANLFQNVTFSKANILLHNYVGACHLVGRMWA